MRMLCHLLAAAACLLMCGCARPLPELPRLDLARLQPSVRKAIEDAAGHAKAKPRDAELVLRLGMVLHAHDQFQAAAACYRRAWALDPTRFDAVYYLGQALASMGEYGGSAECLRRALGIRAGSVAARVKLAEVLRASEDMAGSAEVCRRLISENPNDASAHYGLGRALEGDAAMAEFQKALALFPRYGAAQFALADAYRTRGEPGKAQEALKDYERDKTLNPPLDDPEMAAVRALNQSPANLMSQAGELEQDGRFEEALALLRRAAATDPKLVDAQVDLISVCGRLGRDDEAEQAYRKAVALDPSHAEAYYNFGVFCFERKRPGEAKASFERAVKLSPRHAEALHNWGFILEGEGKWDQAAALYRRAVDAKPAYPLAHFHLGRIYANRNQYALAIREFESTLEPAGEATPAYLYALAATNARSGARVKAIELMRQARAQASARGQTALVASIDHDLATLAR